jgi:ABC-type multidrug transport system fused ATPase/permease subunit
MFGETINLLFRRVQDCEVETAEGVPCDVIYQMEADSMRDKSFELSIYWIVIALGCVIGNMFTFYGFGMCTIHCVRSYTERKWSYAFLSRTCFAGMASERLNKRVRDFSFSALVRQEVAFFDKRSVGTLTTELEDDAARIHAFSGEPIRSLLVALSSVITGLTVSFVFMWPFALLALACIPLMGAATSVEMSRFLGEDESESNGQDELNSPGGIAIETLLNIRTVSALTLEDERYRNYEDALKRDQPSYARDSFVAGLTSGFSMFVQQWVNALQFWWGGWLLFNYSRYSFNDFLISMFSLLFSLFGLGAAFQGISDKKETEKSAGRIFYLLDRKSEIDPLSEEGKKLD